jgi:LmbE family N-acetylglucosaminyl deacetylase
VSELVTERPDVVLAVYAHPDDAHVACGGTLARWAAEGARVHLVILTDGAKGTADPSVVPAELAKVRAAELDEAGALLQVSSHVNLGFGDGELENDEELRGSLVQWIRDVGPNAVFGHDPTAVFFGQDYFNHRDHRSAGWALLDAISPAAALPHYFPDRGAPHQVATVYLSASLEPDVYVDVTSTIDTKAKAVECHRSQFSSADGWAGEAVRLRAEEEGRRCGVAFAEGFRRLRLGV